MVLTGNAEFITFVYAMWLSGGRSDQLGLWSMQQSDMSEKVCPVVFMCSAIGDLSSLCVFTSDLCKLIL